jgi:hypothetical protein
MAEMAVAIARIRSSWSKVIFHHMSHLIICSVAG